MPFDATEMLSSLYASHPSEPLTGVEVVTPHIEPEPETDAEVAARFAVGDIDEYDAPPWDRSAALAELDDCPFDRPDPNLRGLCQPPVHPRDPDGLKRVLTACDRCGSDRYRDVDTGDYTVRRECSRCNQFMGWTRWRNLDVADAGETQIERCNRILSGNLRKHVKPASEMHFDYEQASRHARRKGSRAAATREKKLGT